MYRYNSYVIIVAMAWICTTVRCSCSITCCLLIIPVSACGGSVYVCTTYISAAINPPCSHEIVAEDTVGKRQTDGYNTVTLYALKERFSCLIAFHAFGFRKQSVYGGCIMSMNVSPPGLRLIDPCTTVVSDCWCPTTSYHVLHDTVRAPYHHFVDL